MNIFEDENNEGIHSRIEVTRKNTDELSTFTRFVYEAVDDARFNHEEKDFFLRVTIDKNGQLRITALRDAYAH